MSDFVFREERGLTLVVCEPLERAGFKNAFSTRLGGISPLPSQALSLGNLSRDERENVFENRRRFLAALEAVDWTLVTARQVHSADIHYIDTAETGREPATCDSLVSKQDRVFLAVQTADCLPILIADEHTGGFAAVHAGWRGTLAGIVARTVEQMQLRFDSRPADLRAAFGPAIADCCFEVGPEVIEQFQCRYEYTQELVSRRLPGGKAHLNLNFANRRQLIDAGLKEENIHDSRLCTVCRNDLFFSYRLERGAENPVGRLMGLIGRENTEEKEI